MGSIELCSLPNVSALIGEVYKSDEPVIVYDGDDECLVAMKPAVLERLLFDTSLLNEADRSSLHI